jgi:hypothetical protein
MNVLGDSAEPEGGAELMGRHEDSPDKGSDGEDGIVSRMAGNDHSQVRWQTTTCSTIPTNKN